MHLPEEQIQTGMSVYQTVFAVFMVFGPILGTFAFQSFGIEVSIAITGLAFLLSAGALAFFLRITGWKKKMLGQRYGRK